VEQPAVHEHRGEQREPDRRLVRRLTLHAGHSLARDPAPAGSHGALAAGVADLERDRAVLDNPLLVHRGAAQRQAGLLKEEEHQDVRDDQADRQDRKAARRDVVLERKHSSGGTVASEQADR
jgi:hypothetical protein